MADQTPPSRSPMEEAMLRTSEELVKQLRSLNRHLATEASPGYIAKLQSRLEANDISQQRSMYQSRRSTSTGGVSLRPLPGDPDFPERVNTADAQEEQDRLARQQLAQGRIPAAGAGSPTVDQPGGSTAYVSAWQRAKQAIAGNQLSEHLNIKGEPVPGQQRGLSAFLNPTIPASSVSGIAGPMPAADVKEQLGVSPDASTPTEVSGGRGDLLSPVPGVAPGERQNALNERMKIPQFGEWQLDTKLQMVRDMFLKMGNAAGVGTPDANMFAKPLATAAGIANYGYERAASLSALHQWVVGPSLEHMNNMTNFGSQLGYGAPSTFMGFRVPWGGLPFIGNKASQTGWQGWLDEMLLRNQPGITGESAKQIIAGLAGQGFSPQSPQFMELANHIAAPLVQQGMNPEVATQFAEALRNGDTSVHTLSQTLTNFGQVARAIREPIDQAAESLISFAQNAEQFGATQAQAIRAGIQYSTITGMDPQFLGESMQNPLFQGMMMSQYGILPSGLATANPGTLAQGQLSSLQMAMRATAGLNRRVYQTIDGKRVLIQSGYDAQVAQAAQLAGLQPGAAKRLLRNQHQITARSQMETLLTAPGGWQAEYKAALKRSGGHLTHAEQQALIHGGIPGDKNFISADDILKMGKEAGLSKSTLNKFKSEIGGVRHPLRNFENDIEGAIRNVAKSPGQGNTGNTIGVKFTGLAAKIFQQDVGATSMKANAGLGPLTSQLAGSPIMNSGQLGYH